MLQRHEAVVMEAEVVALPKEVADPGVDVSLRQESGQQVGGQHVGELVEHDAAEAEGAQNQKHLGKSTLASLIFAALSSKLL